MSLLWIEASDPTPPGWYRLQIVEAGSGALVEALAPELRRLLATAWALFEAGKAHGVIVSDHEERLYCCLPVAVAQGNRWSVVIGIETYPAPDARTIKGGGA